LGLVGVLHAGCVTEGQWLVLREMQGIERASGGSGACHLQGMIGLLLAAGG